MGYIGKNLFKMIIISSNIRIHLSFQTLISFLQALMLKKQKPGSEQGSETSSSTSDSNTYYEDDFSSSDDSSAEDGKFGSNHISKCRVLF